MANWHVDQNGKRIGPISQDVLMQMVTAGHIADMDMVWTEGMQTWQRADTQSWFPGVPQGIILPPSAPGTNPFTTTSTAPPPSLMVWSILEIFFCCLITGIVGIVYDSRAKTEYAKGNIAAAQQAFNTGKIWLIVGAIVGGLLAIVYALVLIASIYKQMQ